jgi:hypothetical protein
MFRKVILALGATAVIGAAALTPTAASAKHWHHHHHWFYGGVAIYPGFYAAPDCYIVKRVVWTPWGKRIRRVEVCD